MLHMHCATDPAYMENGFVIHTEGSNECWIIDPGLPPHAQSFIRYIEENGLTPSKALVTHGHADHFAGLDDLREAFPDMVPYLAKEDLPALTDPMENLSGQFGGNVRVSPDGVQDLPHGLELNLGELAWQVLDTSGHSPGGRSFYCAAEGLVFAGDALFRGGIGRTDFHHSNHPQLISNIRNNLLTLPGDTRVISGHGPETTVALEKKANPYV